MPETYTIQQARLIQKGHAFHTKKVDIRIEKGAIAEIGASIEPKGELLAGEGLIVTSGWVDLRSHLSDPGLEHKDTLTTLLDTAAAGGYTSLTTLPHSRPPVADKSGVNYLLNATSGHLVSLRPTGQLSAIDSNGNLAELYDMHTAGAVLFTNGDKEVSNGLLKKALLYTKPFGARVQTYPIDKSLEGGACISESATTIHTGLKSAPPLAEHIAVQQQIEVARYCDAPLHFSCITTQESVALIAAAKKEGVKITCDVSIFHLCFTDEKVLSFDENFKIYPPLRGEEDRKALVAGLASGTIDAICSNHHPQNIESKELEFDYAEFGALSLQFVYPWYQRYLSKELDIDTFISAVTDGPRAILGLDATHIENESTANIVVLESDKEWVFDASTNKSLSKNTHEWGETQKGKVRAIFNEGKAIVY